MFSCCFSSPSRAHARRTHEACAPDPVVDLDLMGCLLTTGRQVCCALFKAGWSLTTKPSLKGWHYYNTRYAIRYKP
ncbi:MAG: hypothetical protein RBR87_12420 [Bacteroidales bacterium]|nr:hypothetical protein [Bacteroidales bacterium]